MLRPSSRVIAAAIDAIWQATAEYKRGDTITHELIETEGGLVRYGKHWSPVINKLKRKFQAERGITLWSVPGVGYKLCTAREQINDCVQDRSLRAVRQLNRAAGHLEAAPTEELSTHEQIVRSQRLESQRQTMKDLRRQRRIGSILAKPTGEDNKRS